MNEFFFENQGTNTYLVYKINDKDVVDHMSLGMLSNNKIPGIATTLFMQMDDNKYIKYNVSSRVSVNQFFSGSVNKKRLLGVFKGIVNALLVSEDYMLDVNSILLDLDYIFADVRTCDTVLICLPIEGNTNSQDLGMFFKQIMFSTQFDQTENCDHVATIINYLNSSPVFSLAEFLNVLYRIEEAESQQKVAEPVQKQSVSQPKIEPYKRDTRDFVQEREVTREQEAVPDIEQSILNVHKPVSNGYQSQNTQPSIPKQEPTLVKQSVTNQTAVSQNDVPVQPEKQITMLGLLMHYSKENAQLYKAQKAAKKAATKTNSAQISKRNEKENKKESKKNHVQFAVPGATPNGAFAMPGDATSASMSMQYSQQPVQQPQQVQTPNVQTQTQQTTHIPGVMPRCESANFGETTILGGPAAGETTVLTASQNPNKTMDPHLIRVKNKEKILIDKPVFRIGKERSYVDYFIGDNTAISRSHANLITRGEQFFIVDTNSTNHTFLNGSMIQSNEEFVINHGDTIRFANEEFLFKLY